MMQTAQQAGQSPGSSAEAALPGVLRSRCCRATMSPLRPLCLTSSSPVGAHPLQVIASNDVNDEMNQLDVPVFWPERRYPWGTAQAFNPDHSDLFFLRWGSMLVWLAASPQSTLLSLELQRTAVAPYVAGMCGSSWCCSMTFKAQLWSGTPWSLCCCGGSLLALPICSDIPAICRTLRGHAMHCLRRLPTTSSRPCCVARQCR